MTSYALIVEAFQGSEQPDISRTCIVAEIRVSENPDCIHYKFTHGEKLAEICASADISIFPSMTETFGNTVTEALASGLVVVAFDYAAAQMHIDHQVNGLLVDYGDEMQFLKTCNEALDYAQDSNFRSKARDAVSELTWEATAQRFIDIANSLLTEKTANAGD